MDPAYATLLGYTEDGYRFAEQVVHVVQSFFTPTYIKTQKPKSYWYATSNPSFLMYMIQQHPTKTVSLVGAYVSEKKSFQALLLSSLELAGILTQGEVHISRLGKRL